MAGCHQAYTRGACDLLRPGSEPRVSSQGCRAAVLGTPSPRTQGRRSQARYLVSIRSTDDSCGHSPFGPRSCCVSERQKHTSHRPQGSTHRGRVSNWLISMNSSLTCSSHMQEKLTFHFTFEEPTPLKAWLYLCSS